MPIKYRPTGVSILAFLTLVGGILALIGSVVFYQTTRLSPPVPAANQALPRDLPELLVAASVLILFIAFGMFNGKGLAWWGYMFLSAIFFGYSLAGIPLIGEQVAFAKELAEQYPNRVRVDGDFTIKYLLKLAISGMCLIYMYGEDVLIFFNLRPKRRLFYAMPIIFLIGFGAIFGTKIQAEILNWGSKELLAKDRKTTGETASTEQSIPSNSRVMLQADVPAFDPVTPAQQIGIFRKGTTVLVEKRDPDSGMSLVSYEYNGKVVRALCKTDLLSP